MTVPDEAVEAAKAVAWERYGSRPDSAYIRTLLAAAAPFIAAQAWDEGFEKGSDWGEWAAAPVNHQPDFTNPYRSHA